MAFFESYIGQLFGVAIIAFLLGRYWPTSANQVQNRQTRAANAQRDAARLTPQALAAVRHHINKGEIISAVKLVRTELALDLRDAKDVVDHLNE